MIRAFIKYFLMLFPLIGVMATLQHMVMMGMSFTPRFYIVPFIVSVSLAFLIARIVTLAKEAETERWRSGLAEAKRLGTLGMFSSSIEYYLAQVLYGLRVNLENKAGSGLDREEALRVSLAQGEALSKHLSSISPHIAAERTTFALLDLICDVRDTALNLASGHAELLCDCRMDKGVTVYGDRSQLYQVFLNLLIQGLQNTAGVNGAAVTMTGDLAEGFARVCIEDNGPGLDEQAAEDLFKPPLEVSRERPRSVGMYIANQILTEHGGVLNYASAGGTGNMFVVCLPLPS